MKGVFKKFIVTSLISMFSIICLGGCGGKTIKFVVGSSYSEPTIYEWLPKGYNLWDTSEMDRDCPQYGEYRPDEYPIDKWIEKMNSEYPELTFTKEYRKTNGYAMGEICSLEYTDKRGSRIALRQKYWDGHFGEDLDYSVITKTVKTKSKIWPEKKVIEIKAGSTVTVYIADGPEAGYLLLENAKPWSDNPYFKFLEEIVEENDSPRTTDYFRDGTKSSGAIHVDSWDETGRIPQSASLHMFFGNLVAQRAFDGPATAMVTLKYSCFMPEKKLEELMNGIDYTVTDSWNGNYDAWGYDDNVILGFECIFSSEDGGFTFGGNAVNGWNARSSGPSIELSDIPVPVGKGFGATYDTLRNPILYIGANDEEKLHVNTLLYKDSVFMGQRDSEGNPIGSDVYIRLSAIDIKVQGQRQSMLMDEMSFHIYVGGPDVPNYYGGRRYLDFGYTPTHDSKGVPSELDDWRMIL
ncbi:MAG: hypothetical protein IJ195_03850 [Lachnospiraceae bacterium]|nr:hypothetical protein [Lachnospiraceae bacterium]